MLSVSLPLRCFEKSLRPRYVKFIILRSERRDLGEGGRREIGVWVDFFFLKLHSLVLSLLVVCLLIRKKKIAPPIK